jgi:tetratricopeptide (TPR) repeat protein
VLHRAHASINKMPEGHERTFATKMLAERLALAGEADEAIAIASGLEENAQEVVGIKVRSSTLNVISQYLSSSGNLAKAREAAGRIQDKDQLGSALWMIAMAEVRQGDTIAAMRTVESIEATEAKIRALVGEYWGREHPGLAVACARAGDQAGAKRFLERARALVATLPEAPKKDESRASLALAEAQLGDVAAGVRQIRALGAPETRDIALGTVALIQAESGAWDDAYRTARSVSDPERRFYAICAFGQSQIKAGKRDAAKETYRKLLAANPAPDTISNYHLGIGQANAGDITAALDTVDRMKASDSQVVQAIVIAQAESGDFEGARRTVAEKIKEDEWKGMSYFSIAYVQVKAGQVKEALRLADSLDHRLHRSFALLGVAQALEERQELQRKGAQPSPK